MNWRDALKEVEEELYSALSALESIDSDPKDAMCSVRRHAAHVVYLTINAWQQYQSITTKIEADTNARSIIRAVT